MKLQKIVRRELTESAAFEDLEYSDSSEEAKDMDLEEDTVHTYTNYVIEVMSAVVFYSDPTIHLDQMLPKIKEAAQTAVRITKYLYKVCDCICSIREPVVIRVYLNIPNYS